MMGEVRKHFRDKGWGVRVPRSLQENYLALKKAQSSLTQHLGREPTTPELADEIGVEPSEIGQIVAAGDSYQSTSLDVETFKDGVSLADTLGDYDTALDGIDNHETLRPALLALPERERTILLYRFFRTRKTHLKPGSAQHFRISDPKFAIAQPRRCLNTPGGEASDRSAGQCTPRSGPADPTKLPTGTDT